MHSRAVIRPWPPFPDADRPRAGGDSGQSPGTTPPDCPHVVTNDALFFLCIYFVSCRRCITFLNMLADLK